MSSRAGKIDRDRFIGNSRVHRGCRSTFPAYTMPAASLAARLAMLPVAGEACMGGNIMIAALARPSSGVAILAIGLAFCLANTARAEVPEHLRGKWKEVGHPENWIEFEDGRNVGGENWEGDWKGHFHHGSHERGKYHFHKEDAHDGKLKLR